MIAPKQHAEADHIIQELKNKAGNPIDEAMRLFTMEGDNWYQANEPDKAIEPYEKAVALKPRDLKGALQSCRCTGSCLPRRSLGAQATCDQDLRAIVATVSARLTRVGQNAARNRRWVAESSEREQGRELEEGDRCVRSGALASAPKKSPPDDWAIQYSTTSFPCVARAPPTGNRAENLKKAVAALKAAP